MKYIDLRSDTVTMPTDEMRNAMLVAEVGDDVYADDPTVNRLERLAATAMGKESALFVPSGTMGNQLAIMSHTKRGDEIILNRQAHIVQHEAGAAAVLSGVSYHLVMNSNGFVYPEDVTSGVRAKDIHYPPTGLVCLENALSNGMVVPLEVMRGTYASANERGVPVHLDGARIFNAALTLGVTASDVARNADSVMFCLSKGLCAPVGSMLCGTADFVSKARRNRKLLGGGMRQGGVLAACGIIALEKMTQRLQIDHANADYLAERLATVGFVGDIDPARRQINMVFFRVVNETFNDAAFVEYMASNGVKINGVELGEYRFVTHNDVSRMDIDRVIELMIEYDKLINAK